MKKLDLKKVTQYVEENIGDFHSKRLEKVNSIKLHDVLKSKNPYLFRAKNVVTASEIIEAILSAYISSGEETTFGNWLERLAIFINKSVFEGRKAGVEGNDLDFDREGKRYIVTIKSGPNWGNDDQVKKMVTNFNTIRKRLKTSGAKEEIVCINGCCYGRSNEKSEYKSNGDYYKLCGQRFWELISNEKDLYTDLIIPIGHNADKKNEAFKKSYGELVNRLTKEFLESFCDEKGAIDWSKLLIFNSGTTETYRKAPEAEEKKN